MSLAANVWHPDERVVAVVAAMAYNTDSALSASGTGDDDRRYNRIG